MCIESRLPSAAAAASNPGWSLAFLVPWSDTITALITLSTKGSDVSAARALTQSDGRLKVGMPTATLARPGATSGAYQPALCSVDLVFVVMSNQIQPPSSNGDSSISNSTTAGMSESPLEIGSPPTVILAPVAFER